MRFSFVDHLEHSFLPKCGGRVGLPGCPRKIFPNVSAKSLAGGCCAQSRTMVCYIFCFFSVCLVCLASVGGLKTSMHQVLVDVILQCQRIIVFYSNVQLFVGVERAILATMHWGIHVCIAFSCCNHPSTQYQTIPSQALASAAGRKRC